MRVLLVEDKPSADKVAGAQKRPENAKIISVHRFRPVEVTAEEFLARRERGRGTRRKAVRLKGVHRRATRITDVIP